MFGVRPPVATIPLEARIEAAAGLPYAAVAGLLERGGDRAATTFLLICRRAATAPREEFDETVLHCFAMLQQGTRDRLLCMMARVSAEALGSLP